MHTADEPAAAPGRGGLTRLRLELSYDGGAFSGWAAQPGRRTVQAELEQALRTVLRIPAAALTVAGRTDAGVHAIGQVAHVDVPTTAWADCADTAGRRLTGVLPADVVVRSVSAVPADFDARFAALWRRYRYCIRDDVPDPLRRHDTVFWPHPLDAAAMDRAAAALIGEHDFAAFCKHRDQASTVRELQAVRVERGDVITCTVQADAFCHSMVRSLVGALVAVGEGRRPVGWPAELLTHSQRSGAVRVMPAHGLTLVAVGYPDPQQWAARAGLTRRRRTAVSLERPPGR